MKFSVAAAVSSVAALASVASAQFCPQATQFGTLIVSPTSFAAHDTVTINADFTCAVQYFGHVPKYTDYYLSVPVNNNGHEPDILLAHHEPAAGTLHENFTVEIPSAYYFSGASYVVTLKNTFASNGPDGTPYYSVGGVEAPVTITSTTN
ncbi:hypothetical protein GLOTRDRAFT_122614 [Gloeophyllum trabeum ATCC 11539]|uniref:Uncharacterized protein n=1 Tax=Gloeophyllum trabeum (strain ATCC 11539 / FP-39264 / Madison 617) TaxID=670483 RepID=S7PYA0_GLOTA|nr:uncharacterized protein GLOTRDRAFT_122614 [Gloeophyllum trabeum ATCC 11539]EPQ52616.1 hypothetical protein GLOTRDRAFT_122614 [Gloeophyllum trabeum ATCC 11539]